MAASRIRMSRFATERRAVGPRIPPSGLADLYREEFLKHQRCLRQQREYYSERVISMSKRRSAASSRTSITCAHSRTASRW